MKRKWRTACKNFHPDWEFKLWNLTAMENFLQEQYPWFWPIFNSYPEQIHKGEPRLKSWALPRL